MGFLTETQLSNVMDIPIALSATDLRMGDWIVVASVKIVSPMRITYKFANLQLMASTVITSDITNGNKIFGNLGLVYLALRLNYSSGSPGAAGGLDALVATSLGIAARNTSNVLTVTEAGVYSWIVANNMQPSTDTAPIIPLTTSIDFRTAVTGTLRLELDSA